MIHWARVQELKEEIGEEDFSDVAEVFLEEVEEALERLKTSGRGENLEADLHFLKSSSLNLGFVEMAAICAAGERAAAEGRGDSVDLEAIFVAFDESKAAFLEGQRMN
ncbi:MAG: Hpt domain-containing protein [Deltaproteobacteria bacterium]|nr:MAG: Hpt domain-containing protein [Deltaproteobacteria bacterium]